MVGVVAWQWDRVSNQSLAGVALCLCSVTSLITIPLLLQEEAEEEEEEEC